MWQSEIEAEIRRNGSRILVKKGSTESEATAALDYTLGQMNSAFPDARLAARHWEPLVGAMTNQKKDRHVLAAAIGAGATHVVTDNVKDFPVASRPDGLTVQRPQSFLVAQLDRDPDSVVNAIRTMVDRHRRPPNTAEDLAELLMATDRLPRFGEALAEKLATAF